MLWVQITRTIFYASLQQAEITGEVPINVGDYSIYSLFTCFIVISASYCMGRRMSGSVPFSGSDAGGANSGTESAMPYPGHDKTASTPSEII